MSLGDEEQKTSREENDRERSVENMKEEGNRCRAHVFAKTTSSQFSFSLSLSLFLSLSFFLPLVLSKIQQASLESTIGLLDALTV